MIFAIDLLRELARQTRRVRLMCPCNPAYERAKADLQQAEFAAFKYLSAIEQSCPHEAKRAARVADGDGSGKGGAS